MSNIIIDHDYRDTTQSRTIRADAVNIPRRHGHDIHNTTTHYMTLSLNDDTDNIDSTQSSSSLGITSPLDKLCLSSPAPAHITTTTVSTPGPSIINRCDTFRMDEDDIFQVDEADLIRGPTLAELNANDDTLLQDLNFDDLLLPEHETKFLPYMDVNLAETGYLINRSVNEVDPSPSAFSPNADSYRESNPCSPLDNYPRSQTFSPCSDRGISHSSPRYMFPLSPTDIPPRSALTPAPGPGHVAVTRLSSSAPTHLTLEQVWQRREPRKHLLSTGSLVEAGSTSSISTGGILSPHGHDFFSQDDDSDEDSDRYEDFSSDDSDDEGKMKKHGGMTKKERYFWQYNVQAKGPKGQRLVLKTKLEDPHILNKVTDPVFSPSCSIRGIKHSGKARKGDGNDLTPNPRKLYVIGKELDNLGRVINDMTPVSELPFNVRPKTRKEKNKLASRACRLKKKAQHEANKLKLHGLENEHKRLIMGISQIKHLVMKKFSAPAEEVDMNENLEKIVKHATKVKIAGNSSEFVNKILDNVKSGHHDGGLDEIGG